MTRHMYYDRGGDPISLDRWGELLENGGEHYRRVARTEVGDVVISTVWLGLDHNWAPDGPPLIFETMVFGGALDEDQWRYTTEEQALAGHEHVVARVRIEASL